MGESLDHILLVENLVAYIKREFEHVFAFVLLQDSANAARGNKPPVLDGFMPDVFAHDVPTTTTIIGEAKTGADLETARSRAQIRTFVEFLRWRQKSIFILAVPFGLVGAARTVIRAARHETSQELPRIVLLHGSGPAA